MKKILRESNALVDGFLKALAGIPETQTGFVELEDLADRMQRLSQVLHYNSRRVQSSLKGLPVITKTAKWIELGYRSKNTKAELEQIFGKLQFRANADYPENPTPYVKIPKGTLAIISYVNTYNKTFEIVFIHEKFTTNRLRLKADVPYSEVSFDIPNPEEAATAQRRFFLHNYRSYDNLKAITRLTKRIERLREGWA